MPTKCIHVFLWFVLSQKDVISYPKNISDVKKGETKKVQDTGEQDVKSLWGQEENIYQQGCVELHHTKQVKQVHYFFNT